MRTLITILLTLVTITSTSQSKVFQLPKERGSVAVFTDPSASIKESGLYYGLEFGYEGIIHAKISLEYFPVLTGGYFSYGGAIGGNIEQEVGKGYLREYAAIRLVPQVFRDGGYKPIYGFEGGIEYTLPKGLFVGIKATYDYRQDMEILGWTPIWRFSGFIKVGYKWDLIKN